MDCGGALTGVEALDGGGDSFEVKVGLRWVGAGFIALHLFLVLCSTTMEDWN
jgi:hypothetical protein